MQLKPAVVLPQGLENLVGERRDPAVSGAVKPQVHLAVFAHLPDHALVFVPDAQRTAEFRSVKHSPVAVVDHAAVAKRRFLGDKDVHRLFGGKGGGCFVQMPLQARCGDQPV